MITAKGILFPHGYPLPPPPDPSAEEQAAAREWLLAWRPTGALNSYIASIVLGEEYEGWSDALEALGCWECNVHLVVFVLDRVVLELWPELGGDVVLPGPDGAEGDRRRGQTPSSDRLSRELSITPPGSFK